MSKTKTAVIGRPQTVRPEIRKHSLLFISRTPKELVQIILPKVQAKMRGGVTDDPQIIKRQSASLYQQIIQFKKQAKEDNKKIDFRGRMVNGQLKKAWLHSPKKEAISV